MSGIKKEKIVKIYHGDCLDFLDSLDDQSVDLGFTDPPYNVGKDYGNSP